jgi:hypothetical protein
MRPKVGFLPRPFSLIFGKACKTSIAFLAAAEAIVGLSQEKATFHASCSAYWRERQKRALAQEEIEKLRKLIQGMSCFRQ